MKTNNRVLMYIVAMCLSFTACDTEGPDVLGVKDGAIVDGVFKVSANKSVRFSQGNLQYTQSTKTWSFAEHQYDILVEKNIVNAEYQGEENWKGTALADKIDLFGWSSDNSTTKWGVSISDNPKDYRGSFVDWGQNTILNGGNKKNQWRTLSTKEWLYLFMHNRCTMAIVVTNNGSKVPGALLLPENFKAPKDIPFVESFEFDKEWYDVSGDFQAGCDGYETNTYSAAQFAQLQCLGVVFLPIAPRRWGLYVDKWFNTTAYWSYYNNKDCSVLYIDDDGVIFVGGSEDEPDDWSEYAFLGYPVRLVQDI